MAEEKSRIRIFELDFCDLLFGKIELADLDLLILKRRNDETVIWKLDFEKLDLDGWMYVKPKWWIRKIWYLFSHVYCSVSFSRLLFLGSFSASFLLWIFLFLKMEKKAGGEMHKTKMRTRKIHSPSSFTSSGMFWILLCTFLISRKEEPFFEFRYRFVKTRTICRKEEPFVYVELQNHILKTGSKCRKEEPFL